MGPAEPIPFARHFRVACLWFENDPLGFIMLDQ